MVVQGIADPIERQIVWAVAGSAAFRVRGPNFRKLTQRFKGMGKEYPKSEKLLKRRYEEAFFALYTHRFAKSCYRLGLSLSVKIRNNLLSSKRPSSKPERDLWIAVIFNAMRDASMLHELHCKSSNKYPYHLERDLQAACEAMRCLTRPSADLSEACELAGFEVSSILARREEFLAGRFEYMKRQVAKPE